MTKDEVLKLALEALKTTNKMSYECWMRLHGDVAITAIEAVLAQPEQEPVVAKRKPLTEEAISEIANLLWNQGDTLRHFARAIESAHGIKD